MNLPYRLEEGIFLEDENVLLPWSESLDVIKQIATPLIDDKRKLIEWNNKMCFGGQKINVAVHENYYTNQNGILEVIDFSLEMTKPRETYKIFSPHFKTFLGQPSEYRDDGYGRLSELWNFNDLQIIIGVGERFVEFEIFSISKGPRRWKLQPTL